MKYGRLILRFAPLLMFLLAVAPPLTRSAEAQDSRYQGRTLEEWKGDLLNASLPRDARRSAAAALGHFGALAVPFLIQALRDPDPGVRYDAVEALGIIGPAARDAIPALVQALRNASAMEEEADRLALTLTQIGAEATPFLLEILKDTSSAPAGRGGAAFFLSQVRPVERGVVEAIGRALGDPNEFVRFMACRGLTALGPEAKDAVFALQVSLTTGRDYRDRGCAAQALGAVGSAASGVVPALRQGLRDQNEAVQWEAVVALGRIGPAAKAAIPELRLIRDRHPLDYMRQEADAAIRKIEGP